MTERSTLPETRGADYQPMRVNGVPVVRNYRAIVSLLRAGGLGSDQLSLFAEPNIDQASGDIRWRPTTGGRLRLFSELSEAERSDAELHLVRLVTDIERYARTLEAANAPGAANLLMALEIPGDDGEDSPTAHRALVGDKPLLFNWGHVKRGPATPQHVLSVLAKRRLAEEERKVVKAREAEEAQRVAEAQAGEEARRAVEALEHEPAPRAPEVKAGTERETSVPPQRATIDQAVQSRVSAEEPPVASLPMIETTASGRYRMLITPGAVVPPVSAWHWSWAPFGWALGGLLFLLLLLVLLQDCWSGLPRLGLGGHPFGLCRIGGVGVTEVGGDPLRGLRDRINDLDDQIRNRQAACTTPRDDANRRVQEQGGRVGALNLVLTWNSDDDLDIHVVCPNGQNVTYSNKLGCGGKLDVDRNADNASMASRPVENVVWEAGAAPDGKYRVYVNRFKARSTDRSASTPFQVELKVNGETVESRNGQITNEKVEIQVLEFELPWRGTDRR